MKIKFRRNRPHGSFAYEQKAGVSRHGWVISSVGAHKGTKTTFYPGERIAEYITSEEDWFNKIINPRFLVHEGVIKRGDGLYLQIGKVYQTTSKKTVTKSNLVFELRAGESLVLNNFEVYVKNVMQNGGAELEFKIR